MMFLKPIIALLVLSTGVSAVRTERRGILRAEEDVMERSLNSGNKKESKSCPKGDREEDYYNAVFLLKDDTSMALCDCSDEQMFEIGELIRKITKEVDDGFPDFPLPDDIIDINTEVCTMPVVWAGNSTGGIQPIRRNLGRKRKRTYTYKSGGTCRRCKNTATRRLMDEIAKVQGRALGDDVPAMMAKEACNLARASRAAYEEMDAHLQRHFDKLNDMEGEADDKRYIKEWEEASDALSDMSDDLEDTVEQVMDADKACSDAKEAAAEHDTEKTKDCLKDAEDAADDVMKGLEKAKRSEADAKDQQMKVVKTALKLVADEAKERTKAVLDKKEKEIKAKEDAIDEELKKAKDSGRKEELEKMMQKAEEELSVLAAEVKRFKDELSDADKHAEDLAKLLMEAEFATDYSGMYLQLYRLDDLCVFYGMSAYYLFICTRLHRVDVCLQRSARDCGPV